jgi:PST family polysaccharide transporter
VNLALPLATIPFLARTLGPSAWGGVLAAQAFAVWTAVLLDYGFTLSATREIARQPSRAAASTVVAGVFAAKLILVACSLLMWLVATLSIPIFRDDPVLALLGWAAGVAQSVNPLWYFQGIQRLKAPSSAYVGGRILSVVAIFALVRAGSDDWIVLAAQASASAMAAIFSLVLQYRSVKWLPPTWAGAKSALRQGRSMFVYRGAVSLYTVANPIIVSLFLPTSQVALYGGAERLSRAALSGFGPISQAVYPHVTYLVTRDLRDAARVALRSLAALVTIGIGGATIGWIAAPLVISTLLGPDFGPSVNVLRILLLSFPAIGASTVLGIQWMVPLGMDRPFTVLVVVAGAVNIILAVALVPTFGISAMAWSVVIAETLVTVGMGVTLWRRRVDPISVLRAVRTQEENMHNFPALGTDDNSHS